MDKEMPFNPDDLTDSDFEFLEFVGSKDPQHKSMEFIDLVLKIHDIQDRDPKFNHSPLLAHFIEKVGIDQISRAEDAIIMGENICEELARVK